MYIIGTGGERAYIHSLVSIHQSDSLVDTVTIAVSLLEGSVIEDTELNS